MTERPCARCGADATRSTRAGGQGLVEVRNARGIALGLFGPGCVPVVHDAVRSMDRRHGAIISDKGAYLSSPRGTPHDPEAYRTLWQVDAGDPRQCLPTG